MFLYAQEEVKRGARRLKTKEKIKHEEPEWSYKLHVPSKEIQAVLVINKCSEAAVKVNKVRAVPAYSCHHHPEREWDNDVPHKTTPGRLQQNFGSAAG